VPYELAVEDVSTCHDAKALHDVYKRMLATVRDTTDSVAHNVILTRQYLIIIPRPRASANLPRVPMPNAAGMAGMLWCSSELIVEGWMRMGPLHALAKFGIPKSSQGLRATG